MKKQYTAFNGDEILASGLLEDVALKAKKTIDKRGPNSILIFDDCTGHQVEIDFRGSAEDVHSRLQQPKEDTRGPGRPKLGVISREVTLLPRHWEWLNAQPSGASVALRKLVEAASKDATGQDTLRQRQEAVYKFMSAMTGNLPLYEEAIRSLFARDKTGFNEKIKNWPDNLRKYTMRISEDAF